jgi:hypothetical protein
MIESRRKRWMGHKASMNKIPSENLGARHHYLKTLGVKSKIILN